jgi:cation transport ATPase
MQQRQDERSLSELFGELARQTGTLLHQELNLARAEMTQKASQASRGVATLIVGGFVAYAGFLALLAAVIAGLATFLDWWLAALLVALVVVVVGYLAIQSGLRSLRQGSLAPRQTIQTIKESAEWAKERVQ